MHVKRKKPLQSTFPTRSFSWMPHWYSQAVKLLEKEGKENTVTSCGSLRKSAVTLIHCCHNSIIYKLCGTPTAVNNAPNCRLSNQTSPYQNGQIWCIQNKDRIEFTALTAQGFMGLFNYINYRCWDSNLCLRRKSPNISWVTLHFYETGSWTLTGLGTKVPL